MNIRIAKATEVSDIMELEREAERAAHWNTGAYIAAFDGTASAERVVLVAAEQDRLDGFLMARRVGLEWEIENVVVAEGRRRQGIGLGLVTEVVERARERGAESVLLEVRESNFEARRLYEKAGFQQQGRRPAYYRDPVEDGLIYVNQTG